MKNTYLSLLLTAALLLSALTSYAADPLVDPAQQKNVGTAATDVLKSMEQPLPSTLNERGKTVPKIGIETDRPESVLTGESTVVLNTFILQGSTVLLKEEVIPIFQPFIGQKITVNQLQQLAMAVTKIYETKGYAASYCFVPPQTLEGGQIIFRCVEGRIGNLVVKNAEEYDQKLFVRFIKPLRDKPLNIFELNERLITLSLMPTFIAQVELKKTDKQGTVDLHIELKAKPLNTAEIYMDNYGSKYSGKERIGASYNIINPTGFGDVLSLQAKSSIKTELSHSASLQYRRRVNDSGGIITLSYGFGDYEVDKEKVASNLLVKGENKNYLVNYKHPLIVGPSLVITGNLQYEFKSNTSDTYVRQNQIAVFKKEDKTNVVSAGTDMEFMDGLAGWNSLSLTFSRGIAGFFDGMRERDTIWTTSFPIRGTIREEVEPDFNLLSASYVRRQPIAVGGYRFEQFMNVYGQYGWERLPSAYIFADGDRGVHAGAGFRFPLFENYLNLEASYQFETYWNSERSKNLIGLSSEDASWLSYRLVGAIPSWSMEYSLSYATSLTGDDSNWEDYRNVEQLLFFVTKRF